MKKIISIVILSLLVISIILVIISPIIINIIEDGFIGFLKSISGIALIICISYGIVKLINWCFKNI